MKDKKLFNALVEVNSEYYYTIGIITAIYEQDYEFFEELGIADVFEEIFRRHEKLKEKFEQLVKE